MNEIIETRIGKLGPLEPYFDKTCQPGEIELVK